MHPIADRAINSDEPITALVADFYGPDGPLAQAGWEIRDQQVTISSDLADNYDYHGEHPRTPAWSVHEAPTGTGKGLAYLVPGILIALREQARWRDEPKDKRSKTPPQMIVSTANIALQEQLIRKDIPAIADMLEVDLRAVLMKGRNNYVCRRQIHGASGETQADPLFARTLAALEGGWDGDKESLTWEPGRFWQTISRGSDECPGSGCQHYAMGADNGVCYWRQAIAGWAMAHVVVVNHHLLALRRGFNACFLSVDEMHEIENSVRSAVSGRLTIGSGRALARRAARHLGEDLALTLIQRPVESLMGSVERAFKRLNPRRQRWPKPLVLKQGWSGEAHRADHQSVLTAYGEIRDMAVEAGCYEIEPGMLRPPKAGEPGAEHASSLAMLAQGLWGLAGKVNAFASGMPDENWHGSTRPWALYAEGRWSDRTGELYLTCHAAPADVSWAISTLQGRYPVAAFTSATVHAFETLRLTYGMQGDVAQWRHEKRLPSPYDLPSMGVTVIPQGRGAPSPKDANWRYWAGAQVNELVRQSQGRALVLASSIAQMRAYGEGLRSAVDYPVKVQGEEGRAALREWFKSTVDGVLVATRSFFQGLDVQGESLSLVVIDRIPFARPGDPVEDAVHRLLVERAGGGSGYMLRSVPDAAQVLAQGTGRLIRSQTDRGVVALLDNRLLKGGDGWKALRDALPPFPTSYDVRDVRRALEGGELKGVPSVQPIKARTNRRRW